MTILDRVYQLKQRPTYDLRINGVQIVPDRPFSLDGRPAVLSMRGGTSFDEQSRVASPPHLEIEVSRIPTSWMRRGLSVTLDAGYDGEHVRVFTGGVWALGEEDPDYLRTQVVATGPTDATGTPLVERATVIGGPPVWPPIPSGKYIDQGIDNHFAWTVAKLAEVAARELTTRARIPKRPNDSPSHQTITCKGDSCALFRDFKIDARDLSGLDVNVAVTNVLQDAGVLNKNVSLGSFTLASSGATMDRVPGAAALTPLLQLQGGHVQQLKSGLTVARVIDLKPAPTASFTYSTTDQSYARIVGADPPLLRVPFNPLLEIGQTIHVELDYLGIDANYFLFAHEWEIGPQGAWSYLDLRGGDEYGGTIGINPIASFTYEVAKQVMGSETYYVVTFIDTSSDPDGTLVDASSTWADNQTTTPEITTFNGKNMATVRIAVASVSGTWTVTRTVVDNDGLSNSASQDIDLSGTTSLMVVPPIFAASGTKNMVTPDGGISFNDHTNTGKTAVASSARLADGVHTGQGHIGYDDGSIDLTTDFGKTWTQALAAVGSPIKQVVWDWRNQILAWAITDDGRLYLSNDSGVSFFLLTNMRSITYQGLVGGTTPGLLGNLVGLPAGGGVYVFGGDGAGNPFIAFNTNPFNAAFNNSWYRVQLLGDIATDAPADATLRIVDYSAAGYKGEAMILSWASGGGANLVAIYHSNDAPGLSKTFTRATGLTAGLKNGRVLMPSGPLSPIAYIALFGDRDVWRSTDGIAFTKDAPNTLPAGFTPNMGLFANSVLAPFTIINEHFLAVEDSTGTGGIMKSADEGMNWSFVRGPSTLVSWGSAGPKCKYIAIGAPTTTQTIATIGRLMLTSGGGLTPRTTYAEWILPDLSGWHAAVALPAQIDHYAPTPFCLTDKYWFVTDIGGFGDPVSKSFGTGDNNPPARTQDGGLTWDQVAIGDENYANPPYKQSICYVCRDASGQVYGVRMAGYYTSPPDRHIEIFKLVGDTWVYLNTTADGTYPSAPVWMAAHPTLPGVMMIMAQGQRNAPFYNSCANIYYTTNGWSTFSTNKNASYTFTTDAIQQRGWIFDTGRLIFSQDDSSGHVRHIHTSDDGGATWTLRYTSPTANGRFVGISPDGKAVFWIDDDGASHSYPVVSTDYGATWNALTSLDLRVALSRRGDSESLYDHYADTLYCVDGSGTGISKLVGVQVGGIWSDITDSIQQKNSFWEMMSIIPPS